MRALMGGVIILASAAAWHRLSDDPALGRFEPVFGCSRAGGGPLCEAARGLDAATRHPPLAFRIAGRLPPLGVAGATDPQVAQSNIDTTTCVPGYSQSARPSLAVTGPRKRRMMAMQHPDGRAADYELDHLIPISLGGAPLDARNLWLQPRHGQANAHDKNVLAFVLWRLVCEHKIPLARAQEAIRHDWIAAYQAYATPANIAKYSFRSRRKELVRA